MTPAFGAVVRRGLDVEHAPGRGACERAGRQRDELQESRRGRRHGPALDLAAVEAQGHQRVRTGPAPKVPPPDHHCRRADARPDPGANRSFAKAGAIGACHPGRLRRQVPAFPREPSRLADDDPAQAVRADAAEIVLAGERPVVLAADRLRLRVYQREVRAPRICKEPYRAARAGLPPLHEFEPLVLRRRGQRRRAAEPIGFHRPGKGVMHPDEHGCPGCRLGSDVGERMRHRPAGTGIRRGDGRRRQAEREGQRRRERQPPYR